MPDGKLPPESKWNPDHLPATRPVGPLILPKPVLVDLSVHAPDPLGPREDVADFEIEEVVDPPEKQSESEGDVDTVVDGQNGDDGQNEDEEEDESEADEVDQGDDEEDGEEQEASSSAPTPAVPDPAVSRVVKVYKRGPESVSSGASSDDSSSESSASSRAS